MPFVIGIRRLSQLAIDAVKNWGAQRIDNVGPPDTDDDVPRARAADILSGRFPLSRMPDGTNKQVLTAQGVGVSPDWANAGDFAAGSLFAASSNALKTITPMTYTKAKEIQIYRGGTLRISFVLEAATPPYTVYGRIYKNGVAVGTERSTGEGPEGFTEDISGWAAGDYVQIYAHTGNTLYAAKITSFTIYVAAMDKFLVTLD